MDNDKNKSNIFLNQIYFFHLLKLREKLKHLTNTYGGL